MNVTSPETNDGLLVRIRDPQDRDAWTEFMSIYRPLIYRVARRFGLQDADAQNMTQEVLQKVARGVSDWESGQPTGSFRRWLSTVARNSAIDTIRRIRPDSGAGGTSIHHQLQAVPDVQSDPEAEFHRELERQAFRWAARRIHGEFADTTWVAFWLTMVEGKSCGEVAELQGKRVGAVYTARSRVMLRLKQELENFDWEELDP